MLPSSLYSRLSCKRDVSEIKNVGCKKTGQKPALLAAAKDKRRTEDNQRTRVERKINMTLRQKLKELQHQNCKLLIAYSDLDSD